MGGECARSIRIFRRQEGDGGTGETHRTSIVRASKDARRAKSFSRAGGSSGIAAPPLAVAVFIPTIDDT